MRNYHERTVVVEYGTEKIPVSLAFKKRKRLSVTVHPDGSVTAVAPRDRSGEEVLAHLRRRVSWIARQRRFFEQFQPIPAQKQYVSGETHLYLGRQYRLRIHRSKLPDAKLVGGYLNAYVPKPEDPGAVQAALNAWYRAHAEPVFLDSLQHCLESAPSLELPDLMLRIRRMKNRWGSCSTSGTITLNLDLIKTPLHCIEYVIMHEICHLRIHNHSAAFFRLLGRCMPDWQRRKERLDSIVLR